MTSGFARLAANRALEAVGLSKSFGPVAALDRVDVRVEPGTVHGLLGSNGAGKTTLLRLLLGLVRPDTGRISLFGREPERGSAPGLYGVAGFVEEPRFYPYLSARRTLELLAGLDEDDKSRQVGELLDLVGLSRQADRRVGGFSTGMRQRLGLAAALLAGPQLLLLDEPTSGLDPSGAREIRTVLRRLAEEGVAVLLSSHDMDEVAGACSSVTILVAGRVIWDGSVERLKAEALAPQYRLETSDNRAALALGPVHSRVRLYEDADLGLVIVAEPKALDAFVLALASDGIAVRRLEQTVSSVEAMFLALTAGAGP